MHNCESYVIINLTDLQSIMYDYDTDFVWEYEFSSHDFLEENYTDDDDYIRESNNNYEQLAYRHYA